MITELVQGKHFFPIWSQAEVLCFAEKHQDSREEQTRARVCKPELPQMLLQKAKNRSAFVCWKWLNQTPCSKMSSQETWSGIQKCCKKQSESQNPPLWFEYRWTAQYLIYVDLLLVLFLLLQEVLVLLLDDKLGQCVLGQWSGLGSVQGPVFW